MRAISRFDQLRSDPHAIASFAHRTFEDIADTQFEADPLHVDGLALVCKARIAGDYEEPADTAERGNDLLDHAVSEVFLLWIAALFWNGSTAIEGLSGNASSVGSFAASARRSIATL